MNFSIPLFKTSWLKSLGLKDLGLKLEVEKSGVEMSFNRQETLMPSPVDPYFADSYFFLVKKGCHRR